MNDFASISLWKTFGGKWDQAMSRNVVIYIIINMVLNYRGACAETAVEAMKAFGLVGSWSVDCAIPINETNKNNIRMNFDTPLFGSPRLTIISPNEGRVQTPILAAERATEDKIKIALGEMAAKHLFFKIGNNLKPSGPMLDRIPALEKCLN